MQLFQLTFSINKIWGKLKKKLARGLMVSLDFYAPFLYKDTQFICPSLMVEKLFESIFFIQCIKV